MISESVRVDISNVTFEPGCRSNCHIHHGARQILVCNWHGAAKDTWFSHLSIIAKSIPDTSHGWMELVDDETCDRSK